MRHALRLAVRQFTRHPAFALVTVLVLGLATGASVAVYTVVDAVLLRPLPYTSPQQLLTIWDTNQARGLTHEPMSPVTLMDYRRLDAFADVAGWWRPDVNLTDPGMDPIRVNAIQTSANLFSLLGVSAQVGPGFPADGPFFDPTRIAVISDRLWRARYQADPALIGKQLSLSGVPHTIVGIMPPRFHFPDDVDVWQRLSWDFHQHSRQAHFVESVARLKPGVDVEQARTQAGTVGERLAKEFAASNGAWRVRLVPLVEEQLGYYRPALIVLFGAVGLLMVIGCLNVASLLLTRALSREREVAVRTALGASPRHLIAQLLAEATVLSIAGAVVGVIATAIAIPVIVAASPVDIPRLEEAAVNLRVLGFAVAIATGTTLLFGLVPALVLIRRGLTSDLKVSERGSSRVSRTLYQVLVAGEVALACALLISSGLLVRTVGRMTSVPTGVHTPQAVTSRIQLSGSGYTDWDTVANVHAAVLDAVRQRPGVRAAGASNFMPFEVSWRMQYSIEGVAPETAGEQIQAQGQTVSDGYFEALGATRLAGRFFTPQDGVGFRAGRHRQRNVRAPVPGTHRRTVPGHDRAGDRPARLEPHESATAAAAAGRAGPASGPANAHAIRDRRRGGRRQERARGTAHRARVLFFVQAVSVPRDVPDRARARSAELGCRNAGGAPSGGARHSARRHLDAREPLSRRRRRAAAPHDAARLFCAARRDSRRTRRLRSLLVVGGAEATRAGDPTHARRTSRTGRRRGPAAGRPVDLSRSRRRLGPGPAGRKRARTRPVRRVARRRGVNRARGGSPPRGLGDRLRAPRVAGDEGRPC